jgi:hypothetical protein
MAAKGRSLGLRNHRSELNVDVGQGDERVKVGRVDRPVDGICHSTKLGAGLRHRPPSIAPYGSAQLPLPVGFLTPAGDEADAVALVLEDAVGAPVAAPALILRRWQRWGFHDGYVSGSHRETGRERLVAAALVGRRWTKPSVPEREGVHGRILKSQVRVQVAVDLIDPYHRDVAGDVQTYDGIRGRRTQTWSRDECALRVLARWAAVCLDRELKRRRRHRERSRDGVLPKLLRYSTRRPQGGHRAQRDCEHKRRSHGSSFRAESSALGPAWPTPLVQASQGQATRATKGTPTALRGGAPLRHADRGRRRRHSPSAEQLRGSPAARRDRTRRRRLGH